MSCVLEHELAATREHLQDTIEELETSNEDLQASNEELNTVNEELQAKPNALVSALSGLNEKRHRSLVEHMNEALMVCELEYDRDQRPVDIILREANGALERLFGIGRSDFPLRVGEANLPELATGEMLDRFNHITKTRQPQRFELRLDKLDKELVFSVYHLDSNRLGVICRDDTERKKMEKELALHSRQLETIVAERTAELEKTIQALKNEVSERLAVETKLKKLSKVFMDAADPIIIEDLQHIITDLNKAAEKIYGYTREELFGQPVTKLIPADHHEYAMELRRLCAREDSVHNWESMRLDRTGKPYPVLITAFVLHGNDHQGESIATIVKDISWIKRLQKEVQQRAGQLARLTSELTLAEQRERHRLAKTLHDHLQQLLAGAKMKLEVLKSENPACDHPDFEWAQKMIMESLETARSLAKELSPPILFQQGLANALKWLARHMEKTHYLEVDVRTDEKAEPEQEELKILLFQSVRELLFNVVKHSGKTAAKVELTCEEGMTKIVVSDQGVGFDQKMFWESNLEGDGGFGLFNIRERLQLMGGSFAITSEPGNGTVIILTSPLKSSTYAEPDSAAKRAAPASVSRPSEAVPRKCGDKIRVLLADDHAVMRNGLSAMLARHQDLEVAGEAANGAEAVEMAKRVQPDVILMDINMPIMDGVEATRRISAEVERVGILGLSMYEADDQAELIKKAGAVGYLSKTDSAEALLDAIRRAAGRNRKGEI